MTLTAARWEISRKAAATRARHVFYIHIALYNVTLACIPCAPRAYS